MDAVRDDEETKTTQQVWSLRRDYSKVELWGFEPQTSSMPWKRSTN